MFFGWDAEREDAFVVGVGEAEKLFLTHYHRGDGFISALCMAYHTQRRLFGRHRMRFPFHQYVAVFVDYSHVVCPFLYVHIFKLFVCLHQGIVCPNRVQM